MRGQCVRIGGRSWGQSHGAFSSKGHGAHTPEGISRLPLCISGDGVFWWRSSVSGGIIHNPPSLAKALVRAPVATEQVAGSSPVATTKHHLAALRARSRAYTGPRGKKRYKSTGRPWDLARGDKPRNWSAGSHHDVCGGNPCGQIGLTSFHFRGREGRAWTEVSKVLQSERCSMFTQEQLKAMLHYNAKTGVFTWKVHCGKGHIGNVAGYISDRGYIKITIAGKRYKGHRLAWFYMKGVWPDDQLDHRDTDRSNNLWNNIRPATNSLNAQNQRRAKITNSTGFLGVMKYGAKFRAEIAIEGVRRKLGVFDSAVEAHEVYLKAKRHLHPGCTI